MKVGGGNNRQMAFDGEEKSFRAFVFGSWVIAPNNTR